MSEQVTLKKKLLQELQFFRHGSSKSNKSSTKSPRRSRWSRSSSKKATSFKRSFFSFQSFNSKEQVQLSPVTGSKTDSLKENAVRSNPGKSSTGTLEKEKPTKKTLLKNSHGQNTSSNKPLSTPKNEKTLLQKSQQTPANSLETKTSQTTAVVNSSPKKEIRKQNNSKAVSPKKSFVQVHQEAEPNDCKLQVSWKKQQPIEINTKEQGPTLSSESADSILEEPRICDTASSKPNARFASSTEITIATREKTRLAQKLLNLQAKGRKAVSKSPLPSTKQSQHRLKRSFSDPCSPRKDSETRVLFQRKQQVHHARVNKSNYFETTRVRNYSVDSCDQVTAKDMTDIENWKKEIKKSTSFYTDTANEEANGKMTNIKYRNSCIEHYYPLMKTKIPEEHVKEDGSITLVETDKRKACEANRDSGVEVDHISSKAVLCNNANNIQVESKDNSLDNANEDESDFDTLKHKKVTLKEEVTDKVDDNTLTRSSQKNKENEEEPEWDMYALLKKFESVEWDLSPASTLTKQTLDLDDCDLDAVPAAVTEIEYYAFRDVEAVSLNNNSKIENADILGKLTDLRVINMWGCNLKAIPQSWSSLTKLLMLGLGGNRELTYFSPLKHLTNLVWLDLGGCGLTKLPDEVTNMMKLRVLALGGNPGIEIGDEICSLWDLKQLGLNGCELECVPQAVFSLTKLTHLHLDNNYICQISQEIVQLTELEELTVTGNSNITFPKILSQCDTIKCIVVDQSKNLSRVSGTLKSRMKQMPTAITPATHTTSGSTAET